MRPALNLQAALDWSLARGDPRDGLDLAAALCWFWIKRVHISTGREAIERGLRATAGAAATATRAKALVTAGSLAFLQGDLEVASARHGEALAIVREVGAQRWEAWAMTSLGGTPRSASSTRAW